MVYNQYVLDLLQEKELALIGFADLSEIDSASRLSLPYGICIAAALTVFPSTGDIPSAAYYAQYQQLNRYLKQISFELEEKIISKGFQAYSLARNVQDDHFTTPLPFKTLATRAGLGWIGRSATLVTKQYGNAVRLNGVITDMPLQTGTPIDTPLCGNCRQCVESCPAQAIKGTAWSVTTPRDALVDAASCKKQVLARGKVLSSNEGSCGICLAVCPWTQRYMATLQNK